MQADERPSMAVHRYRAGCVHTRMQGCMHDLCGSIRHRWGGRVEALELLPQGMDTYGQANILHLPSV
jgi:hypothetical protein